MSAYRSQVEFLVESDPDGGWFACATEHGIFTQGDSEDELRANVLDAVLCHFDEGEAPRAVRLMWPGAGGPDTVPVFLTQ